ncbi:DEAD-box ATP-dependent RNA helicase [Acrasis kona]|uniref:RNA helicase n=1 Tax=Acrasis kona TaxID=1008807 RepID=A0AAW2ZFF6_9EUKA
MDRRDYRSHSRRRSRSPEDRREYDRYERNDREKHKLLEEPAFKRRKQDEDNVTKPSNPYLMNDYVTDKSSSDWRKNASLEDILKKKQDLDAAQSKPIFTQKKERSRNKDLLGENKQDDRRRQIEQMRKEREQLLQQHQSQSSHLDAARQKEIQEIKDEYLNKKEQKKKINKQGDRNRFSFGWNASDDTSRDTLDIPRYESQLQFGRGKLAGTDLPESSSRKSRLNLNKLGKPWQEKSIQEMDERDWKILKEDFEINSRGGKVPNPVRYWEEVDSISTDLLDIIYEVGYKEPTPIQRACIPIGLENRDLIGLAETGSGKTFAFLLPLLIYVSKQPKLTGARIQDGPYALVLVPTRELALQIEEEARKFTTKLGYRVHSVIGGIDYSTQNNMLRDGCEILIATPGRMVDCLESHYVVLNQCNYVVLDEADRMVSMGFEAQLNSILDAMPSSNIRSEDETLEESERVYRQTTMFSATMKPELEKLASKYLRRKIVITIGEANKAVERIQQKVVFCKNENDKRKQLISVLEGADPLIVIFVNTKTRVDEVARAIRDMYRVATIHGGKSQDARETALDAFQNHECDVMVATDVLGRGIDIKDISLVINYDLPKVISTYTHRIGRTGRAGRKGDSVSFFTNEDTEIAYDLRLMLEAGNNLVPQELQKHESAQKPVASAQLITQPLQRKNQVIFK